MLIINLLLTPGRGPSAPLTHFANPAHPQVRPPSPCLRFRHAGVARACHGSRAPPEASSRAVLAWRGRRRGTLCWTVRSRHGPRGGGGGAARGRPGQPRLHTGGCRGHPGTWRPGVPRPLGWGKHPQWVRSGGFGTAGPRPARTSQPWRWVVLARGRRAVPWRAFSSIPRLRPLGANSTLPSAVATPDVSRRCPMSLEGTSRLHLSHWTPVLSAVLDVPVSLQAVCVGAPRGPGTRPQCPGWGPGSLVSQLGCLERVTSPFCASIYPSVKWG